MDFKALFQLLEIHVLIGRPHIAAFNSAAKRRHAVTSDVFTVCAAYTDSSRARRFKHLFGVIFQNFSKFSKADDPDLSKVIRTSSFVQT